MPVAVWIQDLSDKASQDTFRAILAAVGKINLAPFRGRSPRCLLLADCRFRRFTTTREVVLVARFDFISQQAFIPYGQIDFNRLIPANVMWQDR